MWRWVIVSAHQDKLRAWIAAEHEFLAWKTGLEAARRAWQAMLEDSKSGALLMGTPLKQAQSWLAGRRGDLLAADRDFVEQSAKRENKARARARRVQALVYVLLVSTIAVLIGWINQSYLKEQIDWFFVMRPYMVANFQPYVLTAAKESALKAGDSFRESAKDCPEIVVVPAGEFTMGSPPGEKGRFAFRGVHPIRAALRNNCRRSRRYLGVSDPSEGPFPAAP